MDYTSTNYAVDIVFLKAGTYFLGAEGLSDTYYYIAKDNMKSIIVESYEDSLVPETSEQILRIAKNLKIENLQKEDDINLKTCFEYPIGSGNTFSISRSQFSYYNSLYIFKASFTYPFEYLGNEGAKITFTIAEDLESFVSSALIKHQDVYKNRYLVKVNEVNSVVENNPLRNSIEEIMNIIY
jgi:hypothetical protein